MFVFIQQYVDNQTHDQSSPSVVDGNDVWSEARDAGECIENVQEKDVSAREAET